jgi:hypothetical protein
VPPPSLLLILRPSAPPFHHLLKYPSLVLMDMFLALCFSIFLSLIYMRQLTTLSIYIADDIII